MDLDDTGYSGPHSVRPDGSHGFMYDVGVNPAMNRMTTSSRSHPHDMLLK